jgi:AcrR family transcriptional regulator
MGRPARYDVDSLLDGAVSLAADGGPTAVTMSAVAAAVGAPSGSVYHRFPTRAALLSALWLRTLERFHAGLLDAAAAGDPVSVAQHTITWSREHPREARILLYGAADFAQHEWPPEMQQRRNDAQQCVAAAFDRLGRRIGVRGRSGHERIVFALADIPLALIRRHLNAGKPIPIDAEDLVATTTQALLAAEA